MVARPDHAVVPLPGAHQRQAHQRRLRQIKAACQVARFQVIQRWRQVVPAAPVQHRYRQLGITADPLHRSLLMQNEPGAQNGVTRHSRAPGTGEAFAIQAVDLDAQLIDVGTAARGQLPMEQDARLHRRHRIQILNARRRHLQRAQLRLVQSRQRHVGRCDAGRAAAAMQNQLGEILVQAVEQRGDGLLAVQCAAEGPAQMQAAVAHNGANVKPAAAGALSSAARAGAFRRQLPGRVR
ncbi:conserved hypothetical protein, partial [Ricinus communis]